MDKLLSVLKTLPEYTELLSELSQNRPAAVTGIGQINRSHILAAVSVHCGRPLVILCQDDMGAKRLQDELAAFLGYTPPALPGRELTLYDNTVVSRQWEQKRIRQLSDLQSGATQVQILSWESMSLRTMPSRVLKGCVFTLEIGGSYTLDELSRKLTACG